MTHNDLPPTSLLRDVIRAASVNSSGLPENHECRHELGRILARCLVRDAIAGRTDRVVGLLLTRADECATESPHAAIILRAVAAEVGGGA